MLCAIYHIFYIVNPTLLKIHYWIEMKYLPVLFCYLDAFTCLYLIIEYFEKLMKIVFYHQKDLYIHR